MVNIKISSNINQVQNKIARMQPRVVRAIQGSVRKAGFIVERHSKMRSPVDTGRMRSSINTTVRGLSATIRPMVHYAQFVHNGTRFMRAQPFMTRGLNDSITEIRAVFNREIKGALR